MATLVHRVRTVWIVILLSSILLLATSPLPAASASEKSKHKPTPVVELPISVINNRIQFELMAGDTPLTLLLDTGATSSIYFQSDKLTAIAPELAGEATISFPAINRSVVGKRIKALALRAGDFEFISRGGLLIGGDAYIAAQLEAEYDVILGQEFFKAYTVEIDPAAKLLRLYKPGTNLEPYYKTSHKLHMEGHTPHIRFFSRMPWEQRATRKAMLLDTGYPGSMVLWSEKHYRQALRKGQTISEHEDSAGIVSHVKLKFGDLNYENIPVFIAKSVPNQSLKRDGLIGASLLAQYRHVIDFAQAQLHMSPILGSGGNPLQIIDGLIYTPNNENFDLKTYYPKISIYPTLVIFANGRMESK